MYIIDLRSVICLKQRAHKDSVSPKASFVKYMQQRRFACSAVWETEAGGSLPPRDETHLDNKARLHHRR